MSNIKALMEKRAQAIADMEALTATIETEERAFSEEEAKKFDELEKSVKDIDATVERAEAMKRAQETQVQPAQSEAETRAKEQNTAPTNEQIEAAERRAFEAFLRGRVAETRDDEPANTEVNLVTDENGSVIPKSIAEQIISRVVEISPLYNAATRYNVKGTLAIPTYDDSETAITMAFANEFEELESSAGSFASIELKGHLAGTLTKVSKSLINNAAFDIVSFVVNEMAKTIAIFLDTVIIKGDNDNNIAGLTGVTQTVETAAATDITMDEVIDLKDSVPDVFQQNAFFVMSPKTRTYLRKIKDGAGRYLMQDDVTSPFGTTLLGKPVYVSDQMDDIATKKTTIYYGDFAGLAVKLSEEASIEILRERFATQHAVGVVAWLEMDAAVANKQAIAALVQK